MSKSNQKQRFLVLFSEDQLRSIKVTAKRLDMSASAFIRQSCLRNQEVLDHVNAQAIRQGFRASWQAEQL